MWLTFFTYFLLLQVEYGPDRLSPSSSVLLLRPPSSCSCIRNVLFTFPLPSRVPTHPGKSSIYYSEICRTWRVWKMVLESPGNLSVGSWKILEFLVDQLDWNKVTVNFEMFGIPYVMHLGVASSSTSHLVELVGCGWRRVIGSLAHVQYRMSWKSPGIFSKQKSGNPFQVSFSGSPCLPAALHCPL